MKESLLSELLDYLIKGFNEILRFILINDYCENENDSYYCNYKKYTHKFIWLPLSIFVIISIYKIFIYTLSKKNKYKNK